MDWLFRKNPQATIFSKKQTQYTYPISNTIWKVLEGCSKKDVNLTLSYFSSSYNKGSLNQKLANRGIQKIKTIRHPNFLKFYEGADNETEAFYVTESCIPLSELIDKGTGEKNEKDGAKIQSISQCELIWGLFRIISALEFLSNTNLYLLNLSVNIIFLSATASSSSLPPSPTSVDWKIGVVDLLVDENDCCSIYFSLPIEIKNGLKESNILPDFFIRELERSGSNGKIHKDMLQLLNCWQLAKLTCDILKVDFNTLSTGKNSLPKNIRSLINSLFSPSFTLSNTTPPSFSSLLTLPFFKSVDIRTFIFLDELSLQSEEEKSECFNALLKRLHDRPDYYSDNIIIKKIFPALVNDLSLLTNTAISPSSSSSSPSSSSSSSFSSSSNQSQHSQHTTPQQVARRKATTDAIMVTLQFLFSLFQMGLLSSLIPQELASSPSSSSSSSSSPSPSALSTATTIATSFASFFGKAASSISTMVYSSSSSSSSSSTLPLTSSSLSSSYLISLFCNSLVKLFSSPDRAVRSVLLQNIDFYHPLIENGQFFKMVFPPIVLGFSDASPVIRELTVRSMVVAVRKIPPRAVNSTVLKHLATTQMDPSPVVRVNTTICMSLIAPFISPNNPKERESILVAAFTRALKDIIPLSRKAAVQGFLNNMTLFSSHTLSTQIIPCLCPFMSIDLERIKERDKEKQRTKEMMMSGGGGGGGGIPRSSQQQQQQPLLRDFDKEEEDDGEVRRDCINGIKLMIDIIEKNNIEYENKRKEKREGGTSSPSLSSSSSSSISSSPSPSPSLSSSSIQKSRIDPDETSVVVPSPSLSSSSPSLSSSSSSSPSPSSSSPSSPSSSSSPSSPSSSSYSSLSSSSSSSPSSSSDKSSIKKVASLFGGLFTRGDKHGGQQQQGKEQQSEGSESPNPSSLSSSSSSSSQEEEKKKSKLSVPLLLGRKKKETEIKKREEEKKDEGWGDDDDDDWGNDKNIITTNKTSVDTSKGKDIKEEDEERNKHKKQFEKSKMKGWGGGLKLGGGKKGKKEEEQEQEEKEDEEEEKRKNNEEDEEKEEEKKEKKKGKLVIGKKKIKLKSDGWEKEEKEEEEEEEKERKKSLKEKLNVKKDDDDGGGWGDDENKEENNNNINNIIKEKKNIKIPIKTKGWNDDWGEEEEDNNNNNSNNFNVISNNIINVIKENKNMKDKKKEEEKKENRWNDEDDNDDDDNNNLKKNKIILINKKKEEEKKENKWNDDDGGGGGWEEEDGGWGGGGKKKEKKGGEGVSNKINSFGEENKINKWSDNFLGIQEKEEEDGWGDDTKFLSSQTTSMEVTNPVSFFTNVSSDKFLKKPSSSSSFSPIKNKNQLIEKKKDDGGDEWGWGDDGGENNNNNNDNNEKEEDIFTKFGFD